MAKHLAVNNTNRVQGNLLFVLKKLVVLPGLEKGLVDNIHAAGIFSF